MPARSTPLSGETAGLAPPLPPPAAALEAGLQARLQAQPLTWLDHAVTAFEMQLDLEQRLPAAEGDSLDDSAG